MTNPDYLRAEPCSSLSGSGSGSGSQGLLTVEGSGGLCFSGSLFCLEPCVLSDWCGLKTDRTDGKDVKKQVLEHVLL